MLRPEAGHEVGVATLLYISGERWASPAPALLRGTVPPCGETRVALRELTTSMLAAAFWSLRESGAVGLLPMGKSRLPWTKPAIEVEFRDDRPLPTFEARLLAAVERAGARRVRRVADLWFGDSHADPDQYVLNVAALELIETGHAAEGRRGILKAMTGKLAYEPDCERLASLEADAEQLLDRFDAFRRDEEELWDALRAECNDAIAASRSAR